MNFVCLDGVNLPAGQPLFMADNKSYRYGEGLFETMKMADGDIPLLNWHFSRFYSGLLKLGFDHEKIQLPTILFSQVQALCKMNNCSHLARVRLSAFRGNGGVFDTNNPFHYLIECTPLDQAANQLNEKGATVGIFPAARKSCDELANLKSSSYLPYALAARHAIKNNWDDALVLNSYERIADSSIANIFLVHNGSIITPALTEGCVDGVMRKYLLEKLTTAGYKVIESSVNTEHLKQADELFLTNAISGLRWVNKFEEREYDNTVSTEIYRSIIQTIGR